MVQEYVEKCYWPSYQRFAMLTAENLHRADELAKWRKRLIQAWGQIKVDAVDAPAADPLHVGSELPVQVKVHLGPFSPDDVEVQLYHGLLDSFGEIANPQTEALGAYGAAPSANGSNTWLFTGKIACRSSGQYGYSVRVLPKHPNLAHSFEPGLVTWG
jgi:starch phosphorylase